MLRPAGRRFVFRRFTALAAAQLPPLAAARSLGWPHGLPHGLPHGRAAEVVGGPLAGRRGYATPLGKIDKPTYHLSFTCKACSTRSGHLVSKQAYHKGTVLIQCPGCQNRHLIADHLDVFGQGKKSLEQILAEKGAGEQITHSKVDLNKLGDIVWEGPGAAPEQTLIEK